MENSNILITEINSYANLTCIKSIDKYNLIACGDNKGRVLLFDIRLQKPIVRLIMSKINNDIK